MVIISRTFIEDISPRYEGDRIRDHIIPGTFPRRVTEIEFVEDDEIIDERCAECKRPYEVKAITWQRMKAMYGHHCCYACHMRHKKYNNALHATQTLRYISNPKVPFMNDDLIA